MRQGASGGSGTGGNGTGGGGTAAGGRAPDADWSVLMAKSQDGDQQAYAALLRSLTPYVRSLAARLGLTGDESEDAIQDVLLTIHKIRHTYDPTLPFGPWLTAVARRRLIDRTRLRSRRWRRETALTEAHETLAAEESNYLDAAGDARRLRAAIATLPAGQRQAVEMVKLGEMSLKEASARTGQSETALKVAVHRAVRRLRTLLDGQR
jgi:RNA polymerase sigma-70 factor (ECF subfamily)